MLAISQAPGPDRSCLPGARRRMNKISKALASASAHRHTDSHIHAQTHKRNSSECGSSIPLTHYHCHWNKKRSRGTYTLYSGNCGGDGGPQSIRTSHLSSMVCDRETTAGYQSQNPRILTLYKVQTSRCQLNFSSDIPSKNQKKY